MWRAGATFTQAQGETSRDCLAAQMLPEGGSRGSGARSERSSVILGLVAAWRETKPAPSRRGRRCRLIGRGSTGWTSNPFPLIPSGEPGDRIIMLYDRGAFFASVRRSFGNLNQGQVDGFNAILAEAERQAIDSRWTAYMLATSWHETAKHMQPVIETRQPNEAVNPSVDVAIRRLETAWARGQMPWVHTAYWRKDKNGLSWLGRGLPQTTHYANYLKLEKATGVSLTKDPELALDPAHAVTIMFAGMIGGLYTGRKLADHFNASKTDWRGARQIINALEKADVVAGYAQKFHAALMGASQVAIAARPVPSSATPVVAEALKKPSQ